MESNKWSLSSVYDLRCQCHKIYNVMKKHFVLDRLDGRVAHASGFKGESSAEDGVRFPRRSNLTQVANGPPLLRR